MLKGHLPRVIYHREYSVYEEVIYHRVVYHREYSVYEDERYHGRRNVEDEGGPRPDICSDPASGGGAVLAKPLLNQLYKPTIQTTHGRLYKATALQNDKHTTTTTLDHNS